MNGRFRQLLFRVSLPRLVRGLSFLPVTLPGLAPLAPPVLREGYRHLGTDQHLEELVDVPLYVGPTRSVPGPGSEGKGKGNVGRDSLPVPDRDGV